LISDILKIQREENVQNVKHIHPSICLDGLIVHYVEGGDKIPKKLTTGISHHRIRSNDFFFFAVCTAPLSPPSL
jgi:hypothetical protein